jgi:hypothetical protein
MEEAMKKHASSNEAMFNPQAYKSFSGALEAFFATECPQLGGFRTRQVLVKSISDMVGKFYPETSHMRAGQTLWCTVHKDEFASYGKSMQETRLQPVILGLVGENDAKKRAEGQKLRELKKEAVARLCEQAYSQDGCLTSAELAILLKISPNTVGKYIKEWELEHNEVLPRRGSIHDIGPTLTHKKIIIEKLFIEQKSVQQVSQETYHSLAAIQRYISTFKQVLLCKQKHMTTDEIAYAVGRTTRLIKEYEAIIEEYREKNYILDAILKTEVNIESKTEEMINELKNGQMPV